MKDFFDLDRLALTAGQRLAQRWIDGRSGRSRGAEIFTLWWRDRALDVRFVVAAEAGAGR